MIVTYLWDEMAGNSKSGQLLIADEKDLCKFCEIARKEREAAVVFEDGVSVAFLDTKPLFPGHVLLIPKEHYKLLEDVPLAAIEPLFRDTRLLSKAVKTAMGSDGTFIAINGNVSQSVPHLHIHIVPRKFKDGLKGFFWPRQKYGNEDELNKVKNAIKNAVKQTGDKNGE